MHQRANTFAARLRSVMLLRKLTVKQLAYQSGYPYETIRHWRADKHNPRLQACADVAQVLGISPGWLAFGEGDME